MPSTFLSAVGYVTVVIHGGLVTVVIHGEGSCNTGRQHQAEPPAYAQCPRLSFSFAFVVPVAMCIANTTLVNLIAKMLPCKISKSVLIFSVCALSISVALIV